MKEQRAIRQRWWISAHGHHVEYPTGLDEIRSEVGDRLARRTQVTLLTTLVIGIVVAWGSYTTDVFFVQEVMSRVFRRRL